MTFDELMNCHEDNKFNFKELIKYIKSNAVVPMFGAGFSACACKYPTWKELLLNMSVSLKSKTKDEIERLLDISKFEDAAEIIFNDMKEFRFYRKLEQAFDPDKFDFENLQRGLKLIPEIFSNSIITTNFDTVIDDIFRITGKKIDSVFPQAELFRKYIDSALPKSEQLLIKLHGDIKIKDSLIFTRSSYEKVYGINSIDFNKIMPQILRNILNSKIILFIGCGLENDRTMEVIKECGQNKTYFALVELPKTTKGYKYPFKIDDGDLIKDYDDRQKYLYSHNIAPIWFPYKHYDVLPIFLEELANQTSINFKKKNLFN